MKVKVSRILCSNKFVIVVGGVDLLMLGWSTAGLALSWSTVALMLSWSTAGLALGCNDKSIINPGF